jgi:anti-anti-sigma regulatory factor
MATKKTGKETQVTRTISGQFDTNTGFSLLGALEKEAKKGSVSEVLLDFSAATRITAGGITMLEQLNEQMRASGKELIIDGMPTEMYKALKIAGISDALRFSHRNSSEISI